MTLPAGIMARGWCPGALRPMQSGDGLIVRVRPRAGAFSMAAMLAICDAAQGCGNGQIDLTRRGNLQIRGVQDATLAPLLEGLARHDLLDASPQAEAVRNVMLSPLAGADADEIIDMRPLARALEQALASDAALWRLPAKFGFVLDGGGGPSLDHVRADIRLQAFERAGVVAVALVVERLEGRQSLGETSPQQAPAAALAAARSWGADSLASSVRPDLPALARAIRPWIAATPLPDGRVAVGIAAAFGRIDAPALRALAEAAAEAGCDDIRLSPWRALYLVAAGQTQAEHLLHRASELGLIIDPDHPLIAIDACPGMPACASATLDTRPVARALANLRSELPGVRSIHVSGCAKGCARSSAADLVLAARGDRFAVIRAGRADAASEFSIAPDDIARLPQMLHARAKGNA